MDLYKFHSNPETLHGYDKADEIVPKRIYDIAESGKKLTEKQEDAIAKDQYYAYYYAHNVLKKPFLKGEDIIAKDPLFAYYYAQYVLEKHFPKGEDAIAKDPLYAYRYAKNILKLPKAEAKMWPK